MKRPHLRRKGKFHAKDNPLKTYKTKRKPEEIKAYAEACRLQRLANPTEGEIATARILESLGINYQPEHVIFYADRFLILDFWIESHNTAIEVDGNAHSDTQKFDAQRDAFLESTGIRTLRLVNKEVLKTPEIAKANIKSFLESTLCHRH